MSFISNWYNKPQNVATENLNLKVNMRLDNTDTNRKTMKPDAQKNLLDLGRDNARAKRESFEASVHHGNHVIPSPYQR